MRDSPGSPVLFLGCPRPALRAPPQRSPSRFRPIENSNVPHVHCGPVRVDRLLTGSKLTIDVLTCGIDLTTDRPFHFEQRRSGVPLGHLGCFLQCVLVILVGTFRHGTGWPFCGGLVLPTLAYTLWLTRGIVRSNLNFLLIPLRLHPAFRQFAVPKDVPLTNL